MKFNKWIMSVCNGVTVICQVCKERHIVKGYEGNNLEWLDADGWNGSFDCAHGPINVFEIDTICPKCSKLSLEDISKIESKRRQQPENCSFY